MNLNQTTSDKAASREFFELERICEYYFQEMGPFWHLYTDGRICDIIFVDDDDFTFAMDLIAWCADRLPVLKIFTFILMTNHIHIVLAGEKQIAEQFFPLFHKKLRRHYKTRNRPFDFSTFKEELDPIESLEALRSEIAYVNRNAYVVDIKITPYNYKWSTVSFFFNPMLDYLPVVKFNTLTRDLRRKILCTKEIEMSDRINIIISNAGTPASADRRADSSKASKKIYADMNLVFIDPRSYCSVKEAELFFRNAHHYYQCLTKYHEAFSKISKRLGDKSFTADTEMYSVVNVLSLKMHNHKLTLATPSQKIELAKIMHFDYQATNSQIKRILKLEPSIVEALFPKAK